MSSENLPLIGSAIAGAVASMMQAGVFALETPTLNNLERLGTAGLLAGAAVLLARYFMRLNSKDREDSAKLIATKDQIIMDLSASYRDEMRRHSEQLMAEMRSSAAVNAANTAAVRELTAAVTAQTKVCRLP